MVTELKKAIEEAEKLSDKEQQVIARLIVDEISWDKTLKDSEKQLSSLAQEAVNEYKQGKTKPFEP
ncbi:MAG: hypothetical protein AABY93_10170 [Bacteroidota bacterium]